MLLRWLLLLIVCAAASVPAVADVVTVLLFAELSTTTRQDIQLEYLKTSTGGSAPPHVAKFVYCTTCTVALLHVATQVFTGPSAGP